MITTRTVYSAGDSDSSTIFTHSYVRGITEDCSLFHSTMKLPLRFIASLVFIHLSDALHCNVMNTVQGASVQQCPEHITSCMKFVCKSRGDEEIYKGCNDPANPAVACQTLQGNCEAQGGSGQCYTCAYEMCNSSSGISLITVIIIAFILHWT
ncbi:hypothetical protein KIN20_001823 [Parelaphostrongylus tenuis]|uniref:Uncharacterized protein n=1 Tax=Parelaphostrongylus tenuis TaxID=148309 RepID=A0AAD5MDC2_PARTN|nr:hypothetical protein KIN20_001823 [Parelaphostrongylus tenuis]